MAFTKGVTARERERKPGEPWSPEDEAHEWLEAHSHHPRPPWGVIPPVIIIATLTDGKTAQCDLEYRGIDQLGRHQLYLVWPPGKKIKSIRLREITTEYRIQIHIPRRR